MIRARNRASALSRCAVLFTCMALLPLCVHGETGDGDRARQEARILHHLRSASAAERQEGIREAVSLPRIPPEVGATLVRIIHDDPDWMVRLRAIEGISGCPAPSPIPDGLEQALAEALRAPEPAIRRQAAQALFSDCFPAPQDRQTLRALAYLLRDGDGNIRHFAAGALARSRPVPDEFVVERLSRALSDSDPNVRSGARRALARFLLVSPDGLGRLTEYLATARNDLSDWIGGLADAFHDGIRLPARHDRLAALARKWLKDSETFPNDDLLDAAGAVLPPAELARALLELAIERKDWDDSLRGLLLDRAARTDGAALMERRAQVFDLADRYLAGRFSSSAPLQAIHAMGPEATRRYVEHLWRRPARLAALLNSVDARRFFAPPPGDRIPPNWMPWLRQRLQTLNPDRPRDQVRLLVLAGMIDALGDQGASLAPDLVRFRRNPQTREIVDELTKRWHGR